VRYISTRGKAPTTSFDEVLLQGLAPDGGLYVPETWPRLTTADFEDESFASVAARCLHPFVEPWMSPGELAAMAAEAFATFDHKDVAPLVRIGDDEFILELFHGPTLAFKDVAMQVVARMFDRALGERKRRATIIGATSGDTGAAAIEAFRGRGNTDIFILHPKGRVSDVQRRMMTTVADANVHNIAIEGTFDDCQKIVKALFADRDFAAKVGLSGVNSINWARIAVQTVYYFTGVAALAKETGAKSATVSVPTGNFGDAFAGYVAKRMGSRVDKLILAVNANDILHRALTTGRYKPEGAEATSSPAMDIQVASNFERALFEAGDRDAAGTALLMRGLETRGEFTLPERTLSALREDFLSERAAEDDVNAAIADVFEKTGRLIDPHTAVGVAASRKLRSTGKVKGPVIALATAHPAKFPEAVAAAAKKTPILPARFKNLYDLPERAATAPADPEAVRALILKNVR
jgi:threonine synthase